MKVLLETCAKGIDGGMEADLRRIDAALGIGQADAAGGPEMARA